VVSRTLNREFEINTPENDNSVKEKMRATNKLPKPLSTERSLFFTRRDKRTTESVGRLTKAPLNCTLLKGKETNMKTLLSSAMIFALLTGCTSSDIMSTDPNYRDSGVTTGDGGVPPKFELELGWYDINWSFDHTGDKGLPEYLGSCTLGSTIPEESCKRPDDDRLKFQCSVERSNYKCRNACVEHPHQPEGSIEGMCIIQWTYTRTINLDLLKEVEKYTSGLIQPKIKRVTAHVEYNHMLTDMKILVYFGAKDQKIEDLRPLTSIMVPKAESLVLINEEWDTRKAAADAERLLAAYEVPSKLHFLLKVNSYTKGGVRLRIKVEVDVY
jgi:hypothetical protein